MTGPPSNVFVSLLRRFRDRRASASADCTAVGVTSVDAVVGGGAAAGMLWSSGRAPDGGTRSFLEATPGGFAGVVVVRSRFCWLQPVAIGDAPKAVVS